MYWLQWDDRNINYFHRKTIARGFRNHIFTLQKLDGSWTESEQKYGDLLFPHFKTFFTIDQIGLNLFDNIHINPLVVQMKTFVNVLHSSNEVFVVANNFGAWKTPGLDMVQISLFKDN